MGIEKAMRFGVTDKASIDAEVADLYRRPFASRRARRALLKAGHGLHPKGFETIASGLAKLADTPSFLLYGEADRILPDVTHTMDRGQAVLPRAQRQSIPRCGHFLQEDRPVEVAQALGRFFASVPSARAECP